MGKFKATYTFNLQNLVIQESKINDQDYEVSKVQGLWTRFGVFQKNPTSGVGVFGFLWVFADYGAG